MTLELTLEEINAIMGMLGRQPYEQVESLIQKIRAQALPQLPKPVESFGQLRQVSAQE
jgi:hypothetical protein